MQINKMQDEWISCKDRPPKKNGRYLVTRKGLYNNVEILSYAKDLYKVDRYDFHDQKGKAGWYDFSGEYGYYSVNGVVAWMELPKEYEEENK